MSPLVESNQLLFYQTSPATSPSTTARVQGIEVRITPEMLCPFLPGAAKPVYQITPLPGYLPYVSLADLIVFKMDACGLRDSSQGKQREARDAAALLELATEHCALDLNENQTRVAEECLADILRYAPSDKQNKAWWQARLMGKCDPDARKEAKEVLSDMIQSMSLSDGGKKSPVDGDAKRWSMGLSCRTASSSSKTSLDSVASSTSSNFTTSSSPIAIGSPDLPKSPHDFTGTNPGRPRKFSTSQHSPVKSSHSRKNADQLRPRRHSQMLGSLPSGAIAHNGHPLDDGSACSPGLTLTGRFESTPGDEHFVSGSYF